MPYSDYTEQLLLEDEYLAAYIFVLPTGALFQCKKAGKFSCRVRYNDNEPEQTKCIELDRVHRKKQKPNSGMS